MKIIKYIFSLLIAFILITCTDDDLFDLSVISAPSNITANFNISQDNSGLVTITPNADAASLFDVYFGDGTEEYETVSVGESIDRVFNEGTYNIRIVAKNLNGKTAETIKELMVSFKPPENLNVTIVYDSENNFKINVSATADFATFFQVYFGDIEEEEPTELMLGESVEHIYEQIGDTN